MTPPQPTIALPDAEIGHDPAFCDLADADRLFEALRREIPWSRTTVRLFGREIESPRRVSWHGDADARYRYSGRTYEPRPWTEALGEIRDRLGDRLGVRFNGVLANLYRDGKDSMGWHADDERELGPEPFVASVTFGDARRFTMRHRARRDLRWEIDLGHGALLTMAGPTQAHWHHAIPKTRRDVGPRINLTFRCIVEQVSR